MVSQKQFLRAVYFEITYAERVIPQLFQARIMKPSFIERRSWLHSLIRRLDELIHTIGTRPLLPTRALLPLVTKPDQLIAQGRSIRDRSTLAFLGSSSRFRHIMGDRQVFTRFPVMLFLGLDDLANFILTTEAQEGDQDESSEQANEDELSAGFGLATAEHGGVDGGSRWG